MHIDRITIHADRFPRTDLYPYNQAVFQRTREIDLLSPVTLFVGENGTGKSTLMRALAQRCDIHIWEEPSRLRVARSPYEDRFYEQVSVRWTDGTVPGAEMGPED